MGAIQRTRAVAGQCRCSGENEASIENSCWKSSHAIQKSTVEPTFGVIKAAMGSNQFLLHGFTAVNGEWDLLCIACNIKRLHVL
jgi:hypothetical protein